MPTWSSTASRSETAPAPRQSLTSAARSGQESTPFGTGAWYTYTPAGGFNPETGQPPGWNGVPSTAATIKPGFIGAVTDGSGNTWLLPYSGPISFLPASGASGQIYYLPPTASGEVFAGAAYCNDQPYFGASSGNIYTLVSGAVAAVSGSFGELTRDIASDGTNLYGVLPASQNLGVFSFASATSGSVAKHATPMTVPSLVVAGPSGVAVAGWSSSELNTGANCIVLAPTSGLAATANSTTGVIDLLTGTDPVWTLTQAASGTAHPVNLAWSIDSTQLLATDTTDGLVQVYNLVEGLLVSGATLDVTGAALIGMTPTTGQALVTQPSANKVTVLASSANEWSIYGAVSGLTDPMGLRVISDTQAVVGSPSGVTFLSLQNNEWAVQQVVSGLAFTPSCLDLFVDSTGTPNIYVAGTVGASGYVGIITPAGVGPQASWAGSASAIFYRQGQIAVGDPTNNLIQVFGYVGASLQRYANPGAAPAGVSFIGQTGTSVWLCGTSSVSQTRFTAPYRLVPYLNGQVSIFNGSSFTTAALGVEYQPSSLVWGPSGVWVATAQDALFVIDPDATVLVQRTLLPETPQPAGTPLGLSALMFWNQELYAASSLNNGLAAMVPAQASGAPTPPSNLVISVSTITNSAIGLEWNAPQGTTPFTYQAFYRVGTVGNFAPFGGSTSNLLITVSGLAGNTTYNLAVSGTNSAGSVVSNTVTAQTEATIGSPILTGTPSVSGVEILTWTTPVGAAPITYQVFYLDTALTTVYTPFGGITAQNTASIGGLVSGHTYNFAVSGINATGSAVSNIVTQTMPTAPAAPTLAVISTGNTTANANWNFVTGATSYQLAIAVGSKGSFINYGPPTTSNVMAVSGLNPLSTYTFQVTATGTGGSTVSNVASLQGAATAPVSATVSVGSFTNSSALVTYTVSGGSTPIAAQVFASNGGVSGTYSAFGSTVSGGASGSILVAGLLPSTQYFFEIQATNVVGTVTSPPVSGTTGIQAGVSGIQTGVSSSSGQTPTFVGPAGLVVAPGMTITVAGVSISSDPYGGLGAVVNTNYDNATVSANVTGTPCQGAGTGGPDGGMAIPNLTGDTLTVSQMNAALATLTYTAPPSGVMSDVIQIYCTDSNSPAYEPGVLYPYINIAVSIVSGATSGSPVEGYSVYHPTGYVNPASGQSLLLPTGYFATSGNQIVDPNNGNLPVRIMAANWWGMEDGNAYNTESDPSSVMFGLWQVSYQTICNAAVAAGFNAIRLTYCDAGLYGSPPYSADGSNFSINTTVNPGLSGLTVLEMVDAVVDYCGQIGLKIWFGRMWQNPTVGQTALFYGSPSGSLTDWTVDAIVDNFVMLAQRYANNPTVIGIELNNEVNSPPCTFGDGNAATDLRLFWTTAGNAILAVNPNLLIICQSYGISSPFAGGGSIADLTPVANFPVTLNVPNRLVFSIHSYPPDVNSGLQSPESWDPSWGYIYTQGIAPIMLTEYGYMASDTVSGTTYHTAVQEWITTLNAYVTTGSSGVIAGVPADGYPPSMTWYCLNASGPGEGDGSSVNNAGFCLLSASDWQTILPLQFEYLPPVMFYPLS